MKRIVCDTSAGRFWERSCQVRFLVVVIFIFNNISHAQRTCALRDSSSHCRNKEGAVGSVGGFERMPFLAFRAMAMVAIVRGLGYVQGLNRSRNCSHNVAVDAGSLENNVGGRDYSGNGSVGLEMRIPQCPNHYPDSTSYYSRTRSTHQNQKHRQQSKRSKKRV